ncbi:MAG: hypothetical protein Q9200_007545, partial [Gallowayella weberi]
RAAPLTPPRSLHSSTDSLIYTERGESRPVSRRSTASTRKRITLNQVTEDDVDPVSSSSSSTIANHPSTANRNIGDPDDDANENESTPPSISAPPTRAHWKPDTHASICDAPTCQQKFNLVQRRHHCRHCGHVFCNAHSLFKIPLDQNAEFHPMGMLSRACGHCWDQFGLWRERRIEGGNSSRGIAGMGGVGREIPGTGAGAAGEDGGHRGSLANSVPRDWNWSTF